MNYASDKWELLRIIHDEPGCDPYGRISGIVRLVAVDRWLNSFLYDGFITCDDRGKNIMVTKNGQKVLETLILEVK